MPNLATKLLELAALDLGSDPPDYSQPVCSAPVKPTRYYPSLYIDNRTDAAVEKIPDEGKAVVNYRVTSRAKNTRDGKTTHSVTIEVRDIDTKLKELSAICDEVMLARGDRVIPFLRNHGAEAGSLVRASAKKNISNVRGVLAGAENGLPSKVMKETRGDLAGIVRRTRNSDWLKKGVGVTRPHRGRQHLADWIEDDRPKMAESIRNWHKNNPGKKFPWELARADSITSLSSLLDTILFDDTRPRNENGQYQPPQMGGIDPLTMKSAYQQGRDDLKTKIVTGAKALAGLGIVGVGAHRIGKSAGMRAGLRAGAKKTSAALKVARGQAENNITKRVSAEHGDLLKRIAIHKDVDAENAALIRKLQGTRVQK